MHPVITLFAFTGLLAAGKGLDAESGKPPAAPVPEAAETKVVSVTDFGAQPGGSALQTEKLQAAIDACFLRGGGEVRVPAGTFRTGGIRLRSRVTLHLLRGAVLRGSRNPEDYFGYLTDTVEPLDPDRLITASVGRPARDPERDNAFIRKTGNRWNNALIRALNAENVAIVGEEGAMIDGSDCFDEKGEEHYRGPHAIGMHNCRGIILRGYTVTNSANWAHAIFFSSDISAENVAVVAGHDGIHLSSCDNISVRRCRFHTGDDCVAGFDNNNVEVRECELNTACSGLRFGGRNVLVENCRFFGPAKHLFRGSLSPEEKRTGVASPSGAGHRYNMLSAFTYYSDFSLNVRELPGNIVLRNCTIENTDRLLHYNFSGNETWQKNRPLRDIRFENVVASGVSMPLDVYGNTSTPVIVELKNMDFTFRKGFDAVSFIHACNYERIALDHVTVRGAGKAPLIKTWSSGKVELKDVKCDIPEDRRVVPAAEKFYSRPI
ncbi:MAG TPA: glycosyl hydrolase family 28 protein [Candidatus Paceibacterota bacterium]|nr:glycosyl hydrolase family 28 protein [Candidatus Paceibacterota bacterium]